MFLLEYLMLKSFRYRISIILGLLILSILPACNFPSSPNQPELNSNDTSAVNENKVSITFQVHLQEPLPPGDSVFVYILDEVTGLPYHSRKFIMNAQDAISYAASLPLEIGSVIKYRYSREGNGIIPEQTFAGVPVRYRLFQVREPSVILDMINHWSDSTPTDSYGRISGEVTDSSTGQPIQNILVSAGGEQAYTNSDGSYLLDGLLPGTHNLVFYPLDAVYNIHQQGALVASDAMTPASVQLTPAKTVTVIFTVKVPDETPDGAPVRLAGNLFQLGNTFTDLPGGVSTVASRMPLLGRLPDGRHMVTLTLPVGAYIEYKYTLGDGLWSSELTSEGDFKLRQLIVPGEDLELNDAVQTWNKPDTYQILFRAKVPATPQGSENIYIQFNPGQEWFVPLPMWNSITDQGQSEWLFDLTGPFNHLQTLQYRYCSNEHCSTVEENATGGTNSDIREIQPASNPGVIQDEVTDWVAE